MIRSHSKFQIYWMSKILSQNEQHFSVNLLLSSPHLIKYIDKNDNNKYYHYPPIIIRKTYLKNRLCNNIIDKTSKMKINENFLTKHENNENIKKVCCPF